ncbi:hypothetical protein BKA56DRAFT_598467 [Ilyonectria sp. MPI-CAGE-AT-0026]|nr:hypothetical protein BKA56DRAFT_598467 [Ilyonectria sp. MPI-CAGE-AT-0026]
MSSPPDLWAEAFKALDSTTQLRLSELDIGPLKAAEGIKQIIDSAHQKETDCRKNFGTFKIGKRKVDLGVCFRNIVSWLNKFKEVGDTIVQYDPGYAALPWALFRFILQAATVHLQDMENILEILETTSRLVYHGRVLEVIYSPATVDVQDPLAQQSLDLLNKHLVALYTLILRNLEYCYSKPKQHTIRRGITGIFKPTETQDLLDELEKQERLMLLQAEACRGLLSHQASAQLLSHLDDLFSFYQDLDRKVVAAAAETHRVLVSVGEREKRETLEYISDIRYQSHHSNVSNQRTKKTCEWILRKKRFKEWCDGPSSSVILLNGYAGAGKTFLASKVIDHVNKVKQSGQAMAYFYCKRDDETRRNPQGILRSFIRQIASISHHDDMIHEAVQGLRNKLEKDKCGDLDIPTCQGILATLIRSYTSTTFILDALDECDDEPCAELMTALQTLMEECSRLKLFISSRPDRDIQRYFGSQPLIKIQATDNQDDIRKYVQEKLSSDRRWEGVSLELQEEIQRELLERSNGMFQWAALQMYQLSRLKIKTEESIRERLGHLPEGLTATYDQIWKTIDDLDPYNRRLASRACQWVLCALQPLDTEELATAILLDPESDEIDKMNPVLEKDDIVDLCENLLTPQKSGPGYTWTFCHLSAREYFEKRISDELQSQKLVAMACLKHLTTIDYEEVSTNVPVQDWLRFLSEDTLNWPITGYIRASGLHHVATQDKVNFLESDRFMVLLKRFFGSTQSGSHAYQGWASHAKTPPVFAMCEFGICNLLSDWREDREIDLNGCDSHGQSLLSCAISFRAEPIWRFLLSNKVNVENGYPRPLHCAIRGNYPEAFDALIAAGADLDVVGRDGSESALMLAVELIPPMARGIPSQLTFVKRLLDEGANPNLETSVGNVLSQAIRERKRGVIEILLEAGAKPPNMLWALFEAVWANDAHLVRLWIRKGATAKDLNRIGQTLEPGRSDWISPRSRLSGAVSDRPATSFVLLQEAAEFCSKDVIQTLLDAGAEVNMVVEDSRSGTALAAAVRHALLKQHALPERYEILRLMLALGADPNLSDGLCSPLIWAVASPDKEAVQILLDAGAEPNQVFRGWIYEKVTTNSREFAIPSRRHIEAAPTALCGAVASGNHALAELLLKGGADPNLGPHRDCTESSGLYFRYYWRGSVRLSSPWVKRATENQWLSPLLIATKRNDIRLSKILLRAGADPNAIPEGNSSISALAVAAFNGNLEHCKLLMDAGATLNLPSHACFRNVLFAAISGCEDYKCKIFERWRGSQSSYRGTNDFELGSESGQEITSGRNTEFESDSDYDLSDYYGESTSGSEYDSEDESFCLERVDEKSYSAVILLFMQKGMELPMPIYSSIGTVALGYYRIAGESFHPGSVCAFHPGGQFDQFKWLAPDWVRILWALETSPSPRLPLRSRLRRCGFPRPLPHYVLLVLRFRSPAKQRTAWAATIAINGDCSTTVFRKYRVQLHQRLEPVTDKWKAIVPDNLGSPHHASSTTLEVAELESSRMSPGRKAEWGWRNRDMRIISFQAREFRWLLAVLVALSARVWMSM